MTLWRVMPDEDNSRRGRLSGPLFDTPCALGKHGVIAAERGREGDGKTPLGTYPFRRAFYRPDREQPPMTALKCEPLTAELGWCDAPDDPHYNQLVRLPFGPSHEKMWREDHLYDLVVVLGHNDAPVVPGLGSAIFMHIAREGFTPTMGCVAIGAPAMLRFLRMVKPEDQLKIG